MKRRLNGAGDSDSLELLLDTLCNVFGGIVLIACLLAIIPRQQMPPPLQPTHSAEAEMIERRIIAAKEEAIRLQSNIDHLSKTADPKLAELQARRDSLRELQERLATGIKERGDKEFNEAEARALVARGNPETLEEKLGELRLQKSKTEGVQATATDKIRFLEQRSKNLSEETSKLAKGRVQAVRFPRERAATASPFPIIIRYNAVYPIMLDGNMRPNPALERIPYTDDSFRAKPIPGHGITQPNDDLDLIATLKAAANQKCYASLYLYPDSHGVFPDLREALAKAGISYGLEFIGRGQELSFSSEGNAPPEL
jgi:hypothetical protein